VTAPGKLLLRRPSASAPRVVKPDMPSATPIERIYAALELGREGRELLRRVKNGGHLRTTKNRSR
jgi:hypothetical protein